MSCRPPFLCRFLPHHIFIDMKKSELRQLIRECISEALTEAKLNQLFQNFVKSGAVPARHQDDFINLFYPFFNKSQENPELQSKLVKQLIAAAIGTKLDQAAKDSLHDYGINVNDKTVKDMLSRFHPFLVKFLQFINQSA